MIALWLSLALAHPLSPPAARLWVHEGAVRADLRVAAGAARPELGWPCPATPLPPRREGEVALWPVALSCAPSELAGGTLRVESGGPVLVDAALPGAAPIRAVLGPGEALALRPRALFPAFAALGARHLAEGPDHLLFLAGLALVVRGAGPVARAVTAFSAGHLVAAGLVVLGLGAPAAWVELAIAASVLALAVEATGEGGGALARRPGWVCGPLGAVHGLGFGAGLRAALPGGGVLPALLSFHVGVEAAQLAAVGLGLGLAARLSEAGRRRAGWALGLVAATWCVERLVAAL